MASRGLACALDYPQMFHVAGLMIVSKIDLLPHVDADLDRCLACARRTNPEIGCLQLSAATGQGMDLWCDWLRRRVGISALAETVP